MKQVNKILLIGTILTMGCFLKAIGQGNTLLNKKDLDPRVDTRIDNMKYWRKMIELGLVKPNPNVKVSKATKKSSRITSNNVLSTNSPDVLINNNQLDSQSENSIFINPNDPNNPLNSNNSVQLISPFSFYGTSDFTSNDGGMNWSGQTQGTGGVNGGDPSVVIDNNGNFYISFIDTFNGQSVAISNDGGASWNTSSINSPSNPFISAILDKNHLWVDNTPISPYEGNLYNGWTRFESFHPNDNQIEIARSTDGGLSWSNPINISSDVNAGSFNTGVNIQTGPTGDVYAVWSIYDTWPSDETAIGFAKSTNGGVTFTPSNRIISNIRGIRTTQTAKNMRVNSFPSMAVDVSGGIYQGNIYIVWANIGTPGINNSGSIDIYLIRSTDKGVTWSSPIKVNQNPLGKENFFPWITCDPTTGHLSVIYYSDQEVTSTELEVFVANSFDGGNTWNDFKVSDVSFTPSPIPNLAPGYFGDYLSIAARDNIVYPCWTDNRSGNAQTYVSPFVLQNSSCPPVINIRNDIFYNSFSFNASIQVNATNTIHQGADVKYQAVDEVNLLPGFHAQSNSAFLAKIAGCNQRITRTEIKTSQSTNSSISYEFNNSTNHIILYPNPNSGIFSVKIPSNTQKQLSKKRSLGIYNLVGNSVFHKSVRPEEKVNIDLTQYPRGVYILKYVEGDKVIMRKIVYN